VCCRAGWTIPFDKEDLQSVRALRLSPAKFTAQQDGGTVAVRHADGRCAFLEGESDRHTCEIHRAGGHDAMPLACRMFPRLILHDARGTFISLSHFCPTAAGLLFEAGPPAAIVDAPASLAGAAQRDGLNARDVWPPLLRPGVMMDLESYGIWERLAVEMLTREGIAPRVSLDTLDAATRRVEQWSPEGSGGSATAQREPLLHAVRDAFGLLSPPTAVLEEHEPAVKRWLAARLFGTWIAYQGSGLRTIVRYLQACLDIFTIELARDHDALQAIRRSDHLIVHESSSQQLANLLNDRP
jgi:Fe-S-cluster containining protein